MPPTPSTEWIKPKMVMPMHYGTNPFLKGTPAEFKAALGQTPIEVIDMKPGDKKTSSRRSFSSAPRPS